MQDPRDIVNTRLVPFSPEQLFRAVAEPERCARWWGPAGFTNRFLAHDFREGGEWRHVMKGPDGTEYPNESRFVRIERPHRIDIEHMEPHFVLQMDFIAEGAGTRVRWRQRFDTPQVRDRLAAICEPSNEQNFDRLEAELRAHP